MAQARLSLLIALALVVGGCSAVRETWNEWFGEAPAATPAAGRRAEVFYAATDGLAVHAEPSASSPIVGRLALHQRVTRTELARGYANVTADGGLQGWVDNAKLIWRLPTPTAAAPLGAGATPAAATPETAVETPLPTATAIAEPPATGTPVAAPTRPGAEPAIFDPF
jgi:hypothetical protein